MGALFIPPPHHPVAQTDFSSLSLPLHFVRVLRQISAQFFTPNVEILALPPTDFLLPPFTCSWNRSSHLAWNEIGELGQPGDTSRRTHDQRSVLQQFQRPKMRIKIESLKKPLNESQLSWTRAGPARTVKEEPRWVILIKSLFTGSATFPGLLPPRPPPL